jgi:hypothetical protein
MRKGIYVIGGTVRFFGCRKQVDPPGMVWHDGLGVSARVLVETEDDFRLLRWSGTTVVRRDQAELDLMEAVDERNRDTGFLSARRNALGQATVAEFNTATGSSVTWQAIRTRFRQLLGRP